MHINVQDFHVTLLYFPSVTNPFKLNPVWKAASVYLGLFITSTLVAKSMLYMYVDEGV